MVGGGHGPLDRGRLAVSIAASFAMAAAIGLFGISFGSSDFGGIHVPWRLVTGGFGASEWTIVVDVRLPRVVFASFVGAALAASGAVFQAVLRNPLADP